MSISTKAAPVLRRIAVPAADVATVEKRALTTRRPRAGYVAGQVPRLLIAILSNLPTRVRDRLLLWASGQS